MIDYKIGIKRIKISCFRGIESLEFTVNNSSTLSSLVGKNGSYKTTFLEAINLALSDISSKVNEIRETDFHCTKPIEIEIEFDNWAFLLLDQEITKDGYQRVIPCKGCRITIKQRDSKERNQIFSSLYDIKKVYLLRNFLPKSQEYKTLWSKLKNYSQSYLLVKEFSVNTNTITNEKGQTESLETYSYKIAADTKSTPPKDINPEEIPITDNWIFPYLRKALFPRVFYFDKERSRELIGEYNTTLKNILTELDWRYRKNSISDQNNIDDVYKYLHKKIASIDNTKADLLNPIKKVLQERFGLREEYDNLDFYLFNLARPYKKSQLGHISTVGQFVDVQNYGSGIAIIFAASLLIEQAKKSKEPIIILIDEPELHLEPSLQKKFAEYLRDSGFQIVVSTHSQLFMDKNNWENNIRFEKMIDGSPILTKASLIEGADAQFRLLGNDLNDLYIPENVLLVSGKFDRTFLIKCISLINSNHSIQLLDCKGDPQISNKYKLIDTFLNTILKADNWYCRYIKDNKKVKLLLDGDGIFYQQTTIDGWKTNYSLSNDQIKRLNEGKCIEYYYPEDLVKTCVKDTVLKDGRSLVDLDFDNIIQVILEDDEKNVANKTQNSNIVSKQRLNQYIITNLKSDHITCNSELNDLITWILS